MKLFLLGPLLFLVSCNREIAKDINPLTSVIDAIDRDDKSLATNSWNEEYMRLMQDHRRSLNLVALTDSPEMSAVALKHSQAMAAGIVGFGHSGFSLRCTEMMDLLGGGNLCGEIVAMGQKSPQAVFNSWMASPTHRQKIEGSRYTHTGLGYAKNLAGTFYWTQVFLEL